MILKPTLAAMLATGLIAPEAPKLAFPKPAIIKQERGRPARDVLFGMPLTMGMLPGRGIITSSVQFIASTNSTSAAGTTSVTVNKPTGTANGDIIVIGVVGNHSINNASFTLSGFTERMDSGAITNCAVYTKTAGASEPSSYTVSYSASGRAAAVCMTFRSASVGVIGTVSANTTVDGSVTAPGITIANNGSLLLGFFFANQDSDNSEFPAPSGMTFLAGDSDASSVPALAVFSQAVNAGATGDRISYIDNIAGGARAFLMSLSP